MEGLAMEMSSRDVQPENAQKINVQEQGVLMPLTAQHASNEQIPVTRSSMPAYEEYCRLIRPLWENRWLTNMGRNHEQLTKELTSYLDVPHLMLFTNGHTALEAAITALGLTGEVITTPFTFASTTHALVRCGLTPVFCDIDPIDYTMDSSKIEALITDKTSAILPVHVYGNVCNIEEIDRIAKKHGLKVLYDAAHAFGVTYQGKGIGSYGDASMFSFHATKVFNTVEGGAVAYGDDSYRALLHAGRDFGITGQESVDYVGGNAKMDELRAIIGLCNLKEVDKSIANRKEAAKRYQERLQGTRGIRLNASQTGIESNYAYFPVLFDGYKENRDEIYNRLAKENIYTRKYFYPLCNEFGCYKGRFDSRSTPTAAHIAQCVLCLPMYSDLTAEDVDRICDAVLA